MPEATGSVRVVNLTQHRATRDQLAADVLDLDPGGRERLLELLEFEVVPTAEEIGMRATAIADLVIGEEAAMIGGAPFLMSALERALRIRGVRPLYAFTPRESQEEELADGGVRKVQIFRHRGFVDPPEG